jgi:uncharacterized membrane protein SpoIIM required for sporulation
MFELLLNPKKAERKPWELFFVGLFYASLALLFVNWVFASNPIFSKYVSMLTITFTVILSMPFIYFTMKMEEEKEVRYSNETSLLKEHSKAIISFLWLFLGFLAAFSVFYIIFPSFAGQNFQAQIEQYCNINMPLHYNDCIKQYGGSLSLVGAASGNSNFIEIFVNNIYVLIFSLVFSLVFGAGAIFILAWNASVIATAIGIFSHSSLANLPGSVLRYMIHGLPEIAAYFTAALAGGIIGIAIIRNDLKSERFWHIMKDALDLIIIALIILVAAALIEVFVTFRIF